MHSKTCAYRGEMQGDETYAHGHIDLGASSLVACECKQPPGPAGR